MAIAGAALLLLMGIGLVRVPMRAQFPCEIQSATAADVMAPVDGVLAEVAVHEGQQVARGDVLGRLDGDALKAEIDRIHGAIEKAQSDIDVMRRGTDPNEVDQARRRLEESQRQLRALQKSKKSKADQTAAAKQQVAERRHTLSLLQQANVEGAIVRKEVDTDAQRKAAQKAEATLGHLELRAPLSGQVASVIPTSRIGAPLKSSEVFAHLTATHLLGAQLRVSPAERARIAVGAAVRFVPDGHPSSDAFVGKVVAIDADEHAAKDGSVGIEAEIDDRGGLLKPGTRGTTTVEVGRRSLLSFASR